MSESKQNSEISDVTEKFSSPLDLIEEGYWGQLYMSKLNDDNSDEFPIEINLKGNNILIGRNETCDVCIPTKKISGDHGKIVKCNDDNGNELIYFIDQSSNGTWINKVRILKSKVLIKDGDEIMFVPTSKKKERKKLAYILKIFDMDKNNECINNIKSSINTESSDSDINDPTKYESKYKITGKLGNGAYADVFHVINRKTLTKYAMKCIDKSKWNSFKNCTRRPITLLDEGIYIDILYIKYIAIY